MKHSIDKELDMRIDAFLTKKQQKFPELGLRGDVDTDSLPKTSTSEKILQSLTNIKFQLSL